jgi:serine/threonine protein kinase
MSGGDLSALLAGGAGLEPGHALAVAGQIAAALEPEHERGFAHGAIEPANVLLEGDRARLTNFGAGWEPRSGSPEFVAPELLLGRPPSPRADVYSLACLLCALLTGRPPEGGRVPAGVPGRAALERALAADPARRPASAAALMREVRAAGDDEPAPAGGWWRPPRLRRRRRR